MNRREFERRCIRIREIGCLACRRLGTYRPPDVHHLNLGGHAGQVRRGDECTIGLCEYHHRGITPEMFTAAEARYFLGPSLKHEPNAFREQFGTDDALLAWEDELIKACEAMVVA